jgi:ankyrin repeat protein
MFDPLYNLIFFWNHRPETLEKLKQRLSEDPLLVHARTEDGETLLHLAAFRGAEAAVRVLLEFGADPNAQTPYKVTPLFKASISIYYSVLLLLLDSGADPHINARQDYNLLLATLNSGSGPYPDHQATADRVVEILLERGVPVTTSDSLGNTALHLVMWPTPIPKILALGADVNARNRRRETPLIHHAYNEQIVEQLLQHGADVSIQNRVGDTALHRCAIMSENEASVQLLLAAGADPNVTNNKGRTPLHIAAASHSFALIPLLLAAGADLSVLDKRGNMPIALVQKRIYLGEDPYYCPPPRGDGDRKNFTENARKMETLLREAAMQR